MNSTIAMDTDQDLTTEYHPEFDEIFGEVRWTSTKPNEVLEAYEYGLENYYSEDEVIVPEYNPYLPFVRWDDEGDWHGKDLNSPHKLCLSCDGRKRLAKPFADHVPGYLSVCPVCMNYGVGEHYRWEKVAEEAIKAAEWMQFRHNRGSAYYDLDPEFFSVIEADDPPFNF